LRAFGYLTMDRNFAPACLSFCIFFFFFFFFFFALRVDRIYIYVHAYTTRNPRRKRPSNWVIAYFSFLVKMAVILSRRGRPLLPNKPCYLALDPGIRYAVVSDRVHGLPSTFATTIMSSSSCPVRYGKTMRRVTNRLLRISLPSRIAQMATILSTMSHPA